MLDLLAKRWWALALRGAVGLVFGGFALALPGSTLAAIVVLFGAFALVDGVFAMAAGTAPGRQGRERWAPLLQGVLGVGIGVVTLVDPRVTAVALLLYIAAWSMVVGVLQVLAAVRLRREIRNEWLVGLSGIAAFAFGLFTAWQPATSAVAVVWAMGAWAIVWGALLLFAGLKLREYRDGMEARNAGS